MWSPVRLSSGSASSGLILVELTAPRVIFSVCNRKGVPPGLADRRENRSTLKEGSLLSYGAIGIPIDLKVSGLSTE